MKKLLLIHDDTYGNWVFGSTHPTQGRRFLLAKELLVQGIKAQSNIRLSIEQPRPASKAELELAHDSSYISKVIEQGISGEWQGERLDLGNLAALFVGGTLVALENLIIGKADIAVNFPGAKHHAQFSRSSGFCVFNDFAIAGKIANEQGFKVAIFDFDAHHGDGTELLLREEPILTYSVHDSTIFPGTGFDSDPKLNVYNMPLPANSGDSELFEAVSEFNQLAEDFGTNLIFIAAGADGHATDPLSTLNYSVSGITSALQQIRKHFPATPILMGGAGGYQPDAFTPEIWSKVALELSRD
jgi:acetoin utilization protein AcuC